MYFIDDFVLYKNSLFTYFIDKITSIFNKELHIYYSFPIIKNQDLLQVD